ncbi:MAG TPA: hypothetical protein VFL90_17620 [Methylomirabilota bacterium]|nr:hypothetical protein [Methylomirabilota bacterium]
MSNEFLAGEILAHGAYLCGRGTAPDVRRAGAGLAALAARLGLRNEYEAPAVAERESFAFARRAGATAGDLADDGVQGADWLIHVVSRRPQAVDELCGEIDKALGGVARLRRLRGVAQPRNYTGAAMNNWAYARQVVQQPGGVMPNAFLVPLSKTAEWWRKDWMERHTYFLPRYDEGGRMLSEGHALATEAGIAHLLRRTYRHPESPAGEGAYDFLTYFECDDAHVPVFHEVCAALRDVRRNPEWHFVREGPTWHGRRAASWEALFA